MCFKFSVLEEKEEEVPDQLRASRRVEPQSIQSGWLPSCERMEESKPRAEPQSLIQCAPQESRWLASEVEVRPADPDPVDAPPAQVATEVEVPLVKRTSVSAPGYFV